MREHIKDIFRSDHGVVPDDDEINWISAAEESRALSQYLTRILRKLDTRLVRKSQTTHPWHHASNLLMEASMCYRSCLDYACIVVSRAAMEAALRPADDPKTALYNLIDRARKDGRLDAETAALAHELRTIANDFIHLDRRGILDDSMRDVVVVTGEDVPDCDIAEMKRAAVVDSQSRRLSLRAYCSAVRVCEKLVPTRL